MLSTDAVPAGAITKWEWFSSATVGAGNLNKFRIKLCHTSLAALTSTYADNYDGKTPVEVFARDPLNLNAPANSWFGWDFDTSFNYNGTDNLIVEVWWEGRDYAYAYSYWGASSAGRSVYSYIKYNSPYFGYPDAGFVSEYLHYMRITLNPTAVAPTSLGRVKALFR